MLNRFTNDNTRISAPWLLQLIQNRGLRIRNLLQVGYAGNASATKHFLAILDDNQYACDCCMNTNLGIPCHHYFQVLKAMPGLQFSVALVRPR